MTDSSDRRRANESAASFRTGLLTQRQIRCMEELPAGHELVRVRGRAPLVREPDGQLSRIRPSGRLVAIGSVSSVRSYLDVHG
jgi:hypothetical protein